jgi:hypothetical protein
MERVAKLYPAVQQMIKEKQDRMQRELAMARRLERGESLHVPSAPSAVSGSSNGSAAGDAQRSARQLVRRVSEQSAASQRDRDPPALSQLRPPPLVTEDEDDDDDDGAPPAARESAAVAAERAHRAAEASVLVPRPTSPIGPRVEQREGEYRPLHQRPAPRELAGVGRVASDTDLVMPSPRAGKAQPPPQPPQPQAQE